MRTFYRFAGGGLTLLIRESGIECRERESGKRLDLRIVEINQKKGFAKVVPETFDDFWHLYNVIYKGDQVYARTTREIKTDEKYARSSRGERVPVFLGVNVEDVNWDKFLGRLRVHGTI